MSEKECEREEFARLERCSECGSTEIRNNVYFCKGNPIKVYLQCSSCGGFVARYTLKGYTSDKTYESLLGRMRFAKLTSGKRTLHIVDAFREHVAREYEHVLGLIKTEEDQRPVEEIIEEEYGEGLH
jgi:hypothetical protein